MVLHHFSCSSIIHYVPLMEEHTCCWCFYCVGYEKLPVDGILSAEMNHIKNMRVREGVTRKKVSYPRWMRSALPALSTPESFATVDLLHVSVCSELQFPASNHSTPKRETGAAHSKEQRFTFSSQLSHVFTDSSSAALRQVQIRDTCFIPKCWKGSATADLEAEQWRLEGLLFTAFPLRCVRGIHSQWRRVPGWGWQWHMAASQI